MELTTALLFVGVWLIVFVVICYILAVVESNAKKKKQFKEEYKNSPLDVFWRNLK